MWTVYLCNNPRYRQAWCLQSTYMGAFYERPIAFRSGIFIETYRVRDIDHHLVFATYTGLRRSSELARKFNPARLV